MGFAELLFHSVNLVWMTILVVIVFQKRFGAVLEPLVWCVGAQMLFFSRLPAYPTAGFAFVHLLTLIGVLSGYALVRRKRRAGAGSKFGAPPEFLPALPLQIIFIVACLLVQSAGPAIALAQGKPLADVIFGMRTLSGAAELSGPAQLFFVLFHRSPLVGLVLGRLWLNLKPRLSLFVCWWSLFLVFLVTGFASGGRTALAFPIMVVLCADVWTTRVLKQRIQPFYRISRRVSYAVLGVIVVIGMVFQTLYRGVGYSSADKAIASLRSVASDTELWGGAAGDLTGGLNKLVQYVVSTYGESRDFMYGYSVYAMAVNPIPRLVWPGKPLGWGRVLAIQYLNQPWLPQGTSMAAGIAGEGYANGGYPAVLVFSVAFGILFGLIKRGLVTRQSSIFVSSLWITALTWVPGLWRGDWLSNVNRLVYCVVGAFVLYMASRWLSRLFIRLKVNRTARTVPARLRARI